MRRLRHFLLPYLCALSMLGGPLALLTSCAAAWPAIDALPGIVSAVEAVTAAAKANHVEVPADVLAEAKALDKAHEANEHARDLKIAAILAAVRRKPAACIPAAIVVPAPPVAIPQAPAALPLADAGAPDASAEAGR